MTDDQPLLKIGELARHSGLTVRTLHHYDHIGLLQPGWRTASEHRLYDRDDVTRLLQVQHLKGLGLNLEEIARALDDPGFDAADTLARHAEAVRARIAQEQELLTRLEVLQHGSTAGWQDVLEVVQLSERLAHDEPSERIRAALDSPLDSPLALLLDQLAADPDPAVRETLSWAVVRHGHAATAPVIQRSHDENPAVRLQMAHVLSKLADPDAVPRLVELQDDPDPSVRHKAGFALGQLGGAQAVFALAGVLGTEDLEHTTVVTTALAGLWPGPAGEVRSLVRSALADDSPRRRCQAADVLALAGDPAELDVLRQAAADPNGEVSFAALLALGQLDPRTPEVRGAVEDVLTSPHPRTRLLAARLLG